MAEAEECYICFEVECEAGEVCERACDFCRGSNVHLSCLLQHHERNEATEPKCPTCRGPLGAKFCVRFFSQQLAEFEHEYGPDHKKIAITLTGLGNAYGDLGDAEKQRRLLERALVI